MRLYSAARFSLLLLGATLPLVARAQFQPPSKEELEMTTDPKAPGAPAVYLDRLETTDDPHHFLTVYARIKVLNEKGLAAAVVHIPYQKTLVFHASGDNSSRMSSGFATHWDAPDVTHSGEDRPNDVDSGTVKIDVAAIEGRTIHPDGTVVPLTGTPADLLKVKRGRNQVNEVTFSLPSVEVGSIIEYRYQVRYDRYEGAADWKIQEPYFTHHARFSMTPDERFSPFRNKLGAAGVQDSALIDTTTQEILTDLREGSILPANMSVKEEASGNYTLDVTDIQPLPQEPFSPPAEGRAYRVAFYYVAHPDLKDYWQSEMGLWSKKLNQYTEPTQALKNAVQETLAGATSDLDKAKKLYEITEKIDNIDFTPSGEPGIGSGWIDGGSVEKVLLDKKGTSNQIAYLYYALARTAGLNAHVERIASRSMRLFNLQFRDPAQLDTALVVLNIDGKDLTIDPGSRMAPFQTLHWAHAFTGGLALINGKLETIITPEQKVTENRVIHIGSLNVGAQGAVSGSLKVAFIGQEALRLRQMGVRGGTDVVKNEINRELSAEAPAGVGVTVERVVYLDDPSKQLLAIVQVAGELGAQAGARQTLPRNFFGTRQANPYPSDEERTNPVDVHYPAQTEDQITYVLPAGVTMGDKPQDALVKWDENAVYQAKTKTEGNSVTNVRLVARGFTMLEPKDYSGLHDFFQKVVTANQDQIVLTPSTRAGN